MNTRRQLLTSVAALSLGGLPRRARAASETIKLGTLYPAASPWAQVLKTWAQAVSKKTDGRVELQFFWNAQQGDEAAMVGKMKSGQLDGAFVSSVGLGKIHKPVLALQLPGLLTTWPKLDAARTGLKGDFEKGIGDAGFTMVGWADIGAVRLLSRGCVIKAPDDLKGQKPFLWRDDAIQPTLFQVIGGVTPVPLNVPEVLPNLNTGAVNIVYSPSLQAEQFQWSGKLDHLSASVTNMACGGLVLSSKRLASLSKDLSDVVLSTGRIAVNALTKRIRAEDDAAFARLKGKMATQNLGADDQARWDAVFKQVRQRLVPETFSADLVAKLEQYGK